MACQKLLGIKMSVFSMELVCMWTKNTFTQLAENTNDNNNNNNNNNNDDDDDNDIDEDDE